MSEELGILLQKYLKLAPDSAEYAALIKLLNDVAKGNSRIDSADARAKALLKGADRPVISIQGSNAGGDIIISGNVAQGDMINFSIGSIVINIPNNGQPIDANTATFPSKVRVYISHHVTIGTAPAATLIAIRTALEEQGFEVFYDEARIGADPTMLDLTDPATRLHFRKLSIKMALCQAAVILLTPDALQSSWVAMEANQLTSRSMLRQLEGFDFLLCAVWQGVTAIDLANGDLATLQLGDVPVVSGADPAAIAAAVVAQFASLTAGAPKETLFAAWARQTEILLYKMSADSRQAIRNAGQQIGLDLDLKDINLACKQLAEALWQAGWDDLQLMLGALVTGLVADQQKQIEQTATLISLLAPAWIDPRAARWIPVLASRPQGSRSLAVNGRYASYTPEMFIRRAYYRAPNQPLRIIVYTGPVSEYDIIPSICQEIRDKLGFEAYEDDEALFNRLNQPDKLTPPIFIVIPPPPLDSKLIEQLRATFPTITFFMLTYDPKANPSGAAPANVELLVPALWRGQGRDEERDNATAYNQLRLAFNLQPVKLRPQ